ncbi:MAG: NHL repeat-containing protein [Verrucomicrobiia bacterium]|jgi:sugar lactone lactonase YvrE
MKGIAKIATQGLVLLVVFCACIPCALAETVYLSTFNANTIDRFDSNGNDTVFATASSGLNYPTGLALDNSGNLYVANSGGSVQGTPTIEEFTPSGTESVFASAGLSFPTALAFDGSGNLFVANSGNNTVVEIAPNGTGSVFATAISGLYYPAGLTFDPEGDLYVANGNNTILKFGTNGEVSVFATNGLDNPGGLAWFDGSLYVVNGVNEIEKFNPSGQGSTFISTNLMNLAIDLAFDSSGNLYVANHGDSDVLKFTPDGVGSVFASGLANAVGIAIEDVPEPSTLLLVSLALPLLFLTRAVVPSRNGERRP